MMHPSITIYLKVAEAETYNIMGENEMRDFVEFIHAETELAFGESLDVYLWGNSMLLLDSSQTIKRDQLRSTLISIVLGMVISWIFFRSAVFGGHGAYPPAQRHISFISSSSLYPAYPWI